MKKGSKIVSIPIRVLDLDNWVIYLRHTKNKRMQVIPHCDAICAVLREYLRIRGEREDDDYLFTNVSGAQLMERISLQCCEL